MRAIRLSPPKLLKSQRRLTNGKLLDTWRFTYLKRTSIPELLQQSVARRERLAGRIKDVLPAVRTAAEALCDRLAAGHTVFACGNGGSASQAQHFVGELVGRFKQERRSLPAVSLTADTSVLTCIANDYGADALFSRQVEGLMRRGDVLVAFSTSGMSANVVAALQRARELDLGSVAILGRDGGRCRSLATWEIVVGEQETDLIQEAHLAVLHLLCDAIDGRFVGKDAGT